MSEDIERDERLFVQNNMVSARYNLQSGAHTGHPLGEGTRRICNLQCH